MPFYELMYSAGRDINLEILRVEGYRKFYNKIFNTTRFAMLKFDAEFVPEPTAKVMSHLRSKLPRLTAHCTAYREGESRGAMDPS
jgi:valyl-tRNA synthetase